MRTNYEHLEYLERLCFNKSKNLSDESLKQFYKNASIGFANRKLRLTLESANEIARLCKEVINGTLYNETEN